MCIVGMGMAMSRSIASDLRENAEALPPPQAQRLREMAKPSTYKCQWSAQKMHTVATTSPDVYSLKIASLQRLFLIVAKPVSLIQLCTISPASLFIGM